MRGKAAVLCLALLAAGCSTPGPQQRSFYAEQQARMRAAPPAVVVDSCIIRHTRDQVFTLRRESVEIAEAARVRSEAYLRQHGITPVSSAQLLTCGFLPEGTNLVADDVDATPAPAALPIVVRPDLSGQEPLLAAYRRVYQALDRSAPTEIFEPDPAYTGEALDVSVADAELLRADLKARHLVVVRTQAPSLSAGLQIMSGLTAALMTVPAGLPSTIVPYPGGDTMYEIVFVDLERRTLIWKKHYDGDRNDGARRRAYDQGWARAVFDPFIDRDDPGAGAQ
jgi:hypothetical protein